MPDGAAPPDEAAVGRDEFARAMQAVQMLPEAERTVLLLRAEHELSYADIAAATGLTAAAAKVKVFRARAKLASLLQPKRGESV
jgi:RNA polymerase sigma-70 factor (ECF subfamily)